MCLGYYNLAKIYRGGVKVRCNVRGFEAGRKDARAGLRTGSMLGRMASMGEEQEAQVSVKLNVMTDKNPTDILEGAGAAVAISEQGRKGR